MEYIVIVIGVLGYIIWNRKGGGVIKRGDEWDT